MPTYDYLCRACGHELEIFHSISDAPKRKCPKCGKLKLERQIGSGAAVIFKGSGFYETDYRSDSYKKGASDSKKALEKSVNSSSDSKASTDKDAKKSTSKPQGKSESKPKPKASKDDKKAG